MLSDVLVQDLDSNLYRSAMTKHFVVMLSNTVVPLSYVPSIPGQIPKRAIYIQLSVRVYKLFKKPPAEARKIM